MLKKLTSAPGLSFHDRRIGNEKKVQYANRQYGLGTLIKEQGSKFIKNQTKY